MKILVASVTNAPPEILRRHAASLSSQKLPRGVSLDFAYVADPELSDASRDVLGRILEARILEATPKDPEATYEVSEETHHWSKPTFYWLAEQKETLLNLAHEESYDAIFYVDSDLILDDGTLSSLITARKEVVSAVFWTKWTPDAPPLPQVWMSHPYEFQGKGVEAHEFLRSLTNRELIQVGGLGACTLIRATSFDKLSWLPVEGLPEGGMWQGEDRHFCVTAARNHVELWADAWPDILHQYRTEDLERSLPTLADSYHDYPPKVGDLVSVVLEPTEEAGLAGWRRHLRGRLGALPVLPSLEDAIREMKPGEDRLVRVRFPMWWSLENYRGKTLSVLLRLLDAKPWGRPPVLDEWEREPEFLFEEFYEEGR